MDLKKLADPFPATDIEWRVQSAGSKDGRVWARVLAYINNRAIMERLDDVCGPENWRNEFRHEENGAVLCGISIRVRSPVYASSSTGAIDGGTEDWVTKWDGAEKTDIEAVKGGLSNAMKRAGVQWGIGRYLYQLEEGYANVSGNGEHYAAANAKKGYPAFKWDPPALPAWALPGGSGKPGNNARSAAGSSLPSVSAPSLLRPDAASSSGTPSVAPSAPAPTTPKRDEDKMWGGKSLGEHTADELKGIIEEVKDRKPSATLVKACRNVLTNRALGVVMPTPLDTSADAAVERMKKAVEDETADLQFS